MINHKAENQEEKTTAIEHNLEKLSDIIVNCFHKNEQLKKHKVSYLNKISNLALGILKNLKTQNEVKSKKVFPTLYYYNIFAIF
jgi:hypothetical protein